MYAHETCDNKLNHKENVTNMSLVPVQVLYAKEALFSRQAE